MCRHWRSFVLSVLLGALSSPLLAQAIRNGPLPTPLPLFPPDNWWNLDISTAPVDPNSTNFINLILISPRFKLHPDFGGNVDPEDPSNPETYGFPYASVPGNQPRVPVTFVEFGDQSDPGFPGHPTGYPIPEEAKTQAKWIEAGFPGQDDVGGDRHMLIVDRDNHILYELYHTFWNTSLNRWEAGSGAIFSLDTNGRRPETWTSADAAGLAILPGLIRYDEVFGPDPIRHAFRFTVELTRSYVFPASHNATTSNNSNALPLGSRLRLKASKNISGYLPYIQKIFQAMKTYGLIVADNGTNMFIQGTYDTRWNNDELNDAFDSLNASDFEVIHRGWTRVTTQGFHTLTPCRVLDTRNPSGPYGGPALASGASRVIPAAGRCGIPSTAKAIAVNVTAVAPPGSGHVSFFPDTGVPAATSTMNFNGGQTRANNAVLMLSPTGSGSLAVQAVSPAGAVHILLDVSGYFE